MIFSIEWLKATAVRMIRTFAESALAYIGTGAILLSDVDWRAVLSCRIARSQKDGSRI